MQEKTRRLGWQELKTAMTEVPALPISAIYFFCLLCGYYVLRPVRDAFGRTHLQKMKVEIDEKMLAEVATSTGGPTGTTMVPS